MVILLIFRMFKTPQNVQIYIYIYVYIYVYLNCICMYILMCSSVMPTLRMVIHVNPFQFLIYVRILTWGSPLFFDQCALSGNRKTHGFKLTERCELLSWIAYPDWSFIRDSKRCTTPSRRWWVMSVENPLETPNCVGNNSVDRKIQSGNTRLTVNSWSFLHLKTERRWKNLTL